MGADKSAGWRSDAREHRASLSGWSAGPIHLMTLSRRSMNLTALVRPPRTTILFK